MQFNTLGEIEAVLRHFIDELEGKLDAVDVARHSPA
jgi:hypothetical protein